MVYYLITCHFVECVVENSELDGLCPRPSMCILSVYTLLKVFSYYDLSVLSMSVMGFQKKSLDEGWVG